jgi:hypothetical protein
MINTIPDAELEMAVRQARSWRGVLRNLGLPASGSHSLRRARIRAEALGLDVSHFTGRRTWSDNQLREAVASSDSWTAVVSRLGLSSAGSSTATLRSRALALGLRTDHLQIRVTELVHHPFQQPSDPANLRKAGPMLGAAWFMLRGHAVVWPLEPCRYDFLAETNGSFERIQVKTTTYRYGRSRVVSISATRRSGRACYGADEIDHFFVIDEEMNAYLIPVDAVAGRQQIHLDPYISYRVAAGGNWVGGPELELNACASP